METFIWNFHTVSVEYPEGFTMELGNSYFYGAEPRAPDARTFRLAFKTMKVFTTPQGAIDLNAWPEMNVMRLDAFYRAHRQWKRFIYQTSMYGTVICTFKRPLIIPAGIEGGNGAVQSFGVELIEHP